MEKIRFPFAVLLLLLPCLKSKVVPVKVRFVSPEIALAPVTVQIVLSVYPFNTALVSA